MSQKRFLQIANFDEQLHYKDKSPIWIKLHCSLLDDYEFANISDETKFHAVGLMILAARLNNKLPDDEGWLRQKINANTEINLKLLLEIKFLEPLKGARSAAKKSLNARKSKKTKSDVARPLFETALAQNKTDENRTEENRKEHNTTDETREPKPDALSDVVAAAVVVCDFQNSSESAKSSRREIEANGEEHISRNASGALADNRTIEASGVENINRTIEASGAANIDRQTNANAVAEVSVDAAVKKRSARGGNLSAFTLEECLRYVERCRIDGQEIKNPRGLAATIFQTGASDAFVRATLYPQKQAEIDGQAFGAPVPFTDEPCRVCFGARMADRDGKGFRKCGHCRNERGKATGFEPQSPPPPDT